MLHDTRDRDTAVIVIPGFSAIHVSGFSKFSVQVQTIAEQPSEHTEKCKLKADCDRHAQVDVAYRLKYQTKIPRIPFT